MQQTAILKVTRISFNVTLKCIKQKEGKHTDDDADDGSIQFRPYEKMVQSETSSCVQIKHQFRFERSVKILFLDGKIDVLQSYA